jgi:hypothetical protein
MIIVIYFGNLEKARVNMGGFVTDETGKVVMHINSPDILTQESIDFWEKEYGAKLYCSKCGKRLQPGDKKDHHWPYFDDYNRCKKCLEEEEKT